MPLLNGLFEMKELELRTAEPDELCVAIAACGICHTDLTMMSPGSMMVYGHEVSGIVETVGKNVAGFQPGDHVVLSYPYCGVCEPCRAGRPYECVHFDALFAGERLAGSQPLTLNGQQVQAFFGQGGFATHTLVHKSSAVKVTKAIDLKLLAPLGCGIQTGAGSVLNFLKPRPGEPLAVFGTGSVGLTAVMAAHICGCEPIIAVDVLDGRLELAKQLGATHILNPGCTNNMEQSILDISGGIQYAFDTTGGRRLMKTAVKCMRTGGKGCGVSAAGKPFLDRADIESGKSWDELIQGCSIPKLFIPQLIDLYEKGQFPFDKLLTYFTFEHINEAISRMEKADVIKPVLIM